MKHYAFSTDPKDIWGEPLSKGYGPRATVDNLLARLRDSEAAHLKIVARLVAETEALRLDKIRLQAQLAWVTSEVEAAKVALAQWHNIAAGPLTATDYGLADDRTQARERGGNPDRP